MKDAISKATEAISSADALIILAGAGIGVDSGLPDFRGNSGFWKAYPVLAGHNVSFVEIANPSSFIDHPRLAWGFYGHRLNLYRVTQPHQGFEILKKLGESMPLGYFVFTSNVDGQFQKAGFSENNIVECHGSIHYLQNIRPTPNDKIISADNIEIEVDMHSLLATDTSMPHNEGGGLMRPNILMFNDYYWQEDRVAIQESRYTQWLSKTSGKNVVVIEIGAGDAVATIRYHAKYLRNKGLAKSLIQINPNPADYADIVIADGALAALSQINNIAFHKNCG